MLDRKLAQTDEQLIAQIVRQQPEALAALYDRYGRLAYSLALYIVSDSGLAEEIVQDVFFQVWQRAASYNSGLGRVNTWLTSITRHRAIDMLRRRSARPEGSWSTLDGLIERAGDQHVEAEVQQRGRHSQVLGALGQLPENQRQALWLAYFYGLTQQQIADRLGEPLGTVKTRIRLGMQKLRSALDEAGVEELGLLPAESAETGATDASKQERDA